MPRTNGPFQVFERIGERAYKINILDDYGVIRGTFNIGDLSLYFDYENLWENSFEVGQYNADGKTLKVDKPIT